MTTLISPDFLITALVIAFTALIPALLIMLAYLEDKEERKQKAIKSKSLSVVGKIKVDNFFFHSCKLMCRNVVDGEIFKIKVTDFEYLSFHLGDTYSYEVAKNENEKSQNCK